MNYRNICFSCHGYIGDYIVEILKDVQAIADTGAGDDIITPVIDIIDLGKAQKGSWVGVWLDRNGITKLCCRDAIRDSANMNETDREFNLNRL